MYATSPRGKKTVVDVIRVIPVIRVKTVTYVRIVIRAIFAIRAINGCHSDIGRGFCGDFSCDVVHNIEM
jgi:hypothetical protein